MTDGAPEDVVTATYTDRMSTTTGAPRTGARRPDEPELMGAKEAALALGVRQSNIRTLAGLPEPYDVIAASTLWRASDIVAFAQERARRAAS